MDNRDIILDGTNEEASERLNQIVKELEAEKEKEKEQS